MIWNIVCSFCSTEESSTEVNISTNEIQPGAETKVAYLSQFHLTFTLIVWNVLSQLMFLDDRIESRRPPLTMEVKLKPKLRNFRKQNYKLCQISMRSLFLELCVSKPLLN